MTIYQEQIFDADGVQINFVQASDAGKPMVLLHGAASEWQSFLPLIPVFACNLQVYAIDLRGHGKSSWVKNQYHLSDYAKDIQCFLDQHIRQPAIIYGHSLGAQVALAMARQAPACVRALVLGDIPFYYHNLTIKESIWYESFIELYHVLSTMHSAQEMDDYMAEYHPTMEPQRRKARAETMSRVDPSLVAAILEDRHVKGYDTDVWLRQITCPVLLLRGNPAIESALRDEDVTYMVERLQRCEIVHMQEVGHGLPVGESLIRVETFLKLV